MSLAASATRPRFHLAFPVRDLEEARRFYCELLGCDQGRSSADWVDFDLGGHQIVAHLVEDEAGEGPTNMVDGHAVPTRHFGLIIDWQAWAAQLKAAEVRFVIEPYVRFKGEVGEQATMFLLDPSGNALEFKAFRDERMIFAK